MTRDEKVKLALIARDGIVKQLESMIGRGRAQSAAFASLVASLAYYNGMLAQLGATENCGAARNSA